MSFLVFLGVLYYFGVFSLAGSSTDGIFAGFSSVILNCLIFWLALSGYLVYLSLFPSLE